MPNHRITIFLNHSINFIMHTIERYNVASAYHYLKVESHPSFFVRHFNCRGMSVHIAVKPEICDLF